MSSIPSAIKLPTLLDAWPSDSFRNTIKQKLEQLDRSLLPLQQGLSQGSYVTEDPINVLIISVNQNKESVLVKAGIFYRSIIAGCNCADDPTSVDTVQEYCVVQFDINQNTAETRIELLTD